MMESAKQYRDEAAKLDQRAQESFERCDTDGFLSQWASQESARKCRIQADIIEKGGVECFTGLYEGDRRVKARFGSSTHYGQISFWWLLHEDEADLIQRRGKKFLPTGEKSRVQKQLGLSERFEYAPAEAAFNRNGRACFTRSGDKWGQDAKLTEGAA
jgi:hypothetical protein